MLFIDMRKTGGGGWEDNRKMRGNYVLRPKWRNQINTPIYRFEDRTRDKDWRVFAIGDIRNCGTG